MHSAAAVWAGVGEACKQNEPANGDGGQPRAKVVRELLARRIKDAAKRKEVTSGGDEAIEESRPAAWKG